MHDELQDAISQLEKYKSQGKSFYEAAELLRQHGFTQTQITDASSQFNYTDPQVSGRNAETSLPKTPHAISSKVHPKQYEKLGNRLLADKERNTRLFIYTSFMISFGYIGLSAPRYYTYIRSLDSSRPPRNLWAQGFADFGNTNIGWGLLFGVVGMMTALIGLKIYYRRRDRWYKQIEKGIDKK